GLARMGCELYEPPPTPSPALASGSIPRGRVHPPLPVRRQRRLRLARPAFVEDVGRQRALAGARRRIQQRQRDDVALRVAAAQQQRGLEHLRMSPPGSAADTWSSAASGLPKYDSMA